MKTIFAEDSLEDAIVDFLKDNFQYGKVDGRQLHRKESDILLQEDLRDYLLHKYADARLTENEITTIINRIALIPSASLYEGVREVYRLLNSGFDLQRDDPSLSSVHIHYVDFEDVHANTFKAVTQYQVQDVRTRRPDVLIFVNGIPLVICELKSAAREDTTIYDAWLQIHNRYRRDIPSLLKYCLASVITDGANAKLGTIFTPYEYYYAWKKANSDDEINEGIGALFTLLRGVFAPERLLTLLNDYVYFPDTSSKELCVICRYPQFFATEALFNNILAHLKPEGDGKGGTYFGATGCGKTYTMLFLARQLMLRANSKLHNPTVIVITDRDDLDTQTSALFTESKQFLRDENVRSIESRIDLKDALSASQSGGVYVTTIQKFCETTGLLSDRANIICISDEAHRSQTNIGSKLVISDDGVRTSFGFAKYLRDSLPNATYVGFTGTPIDETIAVFGDVVDRYTMKQACADKITVPITYEPRLARVLINEEQALAIEEYYKQCEAAGSSTQQIEDSKRAMASMRSILSHPDRMRKLAADIIVHYESLVAERPDAIQKAMIVCDDRVRAWKLIQEILALRPEWGEVKRSPREDSLPREELLKLQPLERIKLVATRNKDDEQELYDLLGNSEHRKMLDGQFKNVNSNFQIAVVVDMWITGFDVPSLAVMYIDKPLQRHTLIQTISRVNRVYKDKDQGLVVDYFGIKENMLKALKQYGDDDEPFVDINAVGKIFRNQLDLLKRLMCNFNYSAFLSGTSLEKLHCLNEAVEYVQQTNEQVTRYMGISKRLKAAYEICVPAGLLTDDESALAQFFLAVRSIIYKQTKGDAPDTETMNRHVEEMIKEALKVSGIENVLDASDDPSSIFDPDIEAKLAEVKLPITKYNALLKLLRQAIGEYGKRNKVKSIEFNKRLALIVDRYNTRDELTFVSEVLNDFVEDLSGELLKLYSDLLADMASFEDLGISYEEKAFYDILIKVRDEHNFEYAEDKCVELARKIHELVKEKAAYTDWAVRNDIKNQLKMDLTILLYKNGYPPQWDEEVFEQVVEQAENFKRADD